MCVRNHTQTHIHIHTSTSHTKAGPARGRCVRTRAGIHTSVFPNRSYPARSERARARERGAATEGSTDPRPDMCWARTYRLVTKLLIHAEQESHSHRIAVPLVGARVRVPGCRKASGPSGPRAIDNLVSVGVRVVRRTVGAGAAPAAESDVVNVAFFANPRSLRQGS